MGVFLTIPKTYYYKKLPNFSELNRALATGIADGFSDVAPAFSARSATPAHYAPVLPGF